MLEGIAMLYVLGVVISIVLFILVVRFLWIVPTSLRSISNCLWSLYDTLLDKKARDFEDNNRDKNNVNFY